MGHAARRASTPTWRGAAQIVHTVWEGLAGLVDQALAHSGDADQGIWEIRGEPQHFTASAVLCWVAADRGADLALRRGATERADDGGSGRTRSKRRSWPRASTSTGRFRQAYENDELDASLLLIPIMGFLPPDDERVRATVLAIADELTEDGLVLRYKVDTTDTGFEGKEGTFTICSWWLVTALAMIGEVERARALCKKLLSFAGPLNLYAEEIDATDGGAPRELPPGLHPPGPDRRGVATHRRGGRHRCLIRRLRVACVPQSRSTGPHGPDDTAWRDLRPWPA